MEILRTPDERFENLPGYDFAPNYADVDDGEGHTVRMHYLDEGQKDGQIILAMHGQPVWSYLYRKMIPLLVAKGYRVIAPDLIGFGRSDKPTEPDDYTYARHVGWVTSLVTQLALQNVTFFGQDWGGLIGLRVVAENEARFARVCIGNTGLPDAKGVPAELAPKMHAYYESIDVPTAEGLGQHFVENTNGMGFLHWVKFAAEASDFVVSTMVKNSSPVGIADDEAAAFDAPFPSDEYMAGARKFPSLVPIIPDNPAIPANKAAWAVFHKWEKPFLTAFSDMDPVTNGGEKRFQEEVPGAKGQPHTTITTAGHFLQHDQPEALVTVIVDFIENNPLD